MIFLVWWGELKLSLVTMFRCLVLGGVVVGEGGGRPCVVLFLMGVLQVMCNFHGA